MENEKELMTEDDQQVTELETESEKEEEPQEETEKESEETPEAEEKDEEENPKADPKAEKRINKLTAINKSLQEELAKAKEALEEAKETLDRKDKALSEEKASYAQGFEFIYTKNGKQMFELTEDEFDAVIDECLSNPDVEQGKKLLAECRAQRKLGKPIQQKQAEVEKGEQELWEYEWGLITKAVLDEETGNPELKKHVDKLANQIAPIFLKRKEDKELGLLYRQLTEGGIDAKMKHLTRLMKKLDLFKLIQEDAPTPETIGKGKKTPVSAGKEKVFTREQIAKMSLEEFEKNEAAIDKAMAEGRVK